MNIDKKTGLLVQVARFYYEHNLSQGQIAERLGMSRPYVSKLIAEARDKGYVTIQVHDPTKTESVLEQRIRSRFELRRAILVPDVPGEDILFQIGCAASRYLDSIVHSGDIIGVSWGATLMACSMQAIPRHNLENITVVQLCGGITNVERNIYAMEIPKNLANAYGGVPYALPLPAILDDVAVKRSLMKDQHIGHVMELASRSNIAMFTVGAFGDNSALLQAGYLSEEMVAEMEAAGAVGDICTHIINIHGEICDTELDERTIAIPLKTLHSKEYRIVVAVGEQKVDSLCAALNGGHANVLVSDESTAQSILRRLDQLEV